MEYEKIKKLIDDMGDSKLSFLELELPDGVRLTMKKEEKVQVVSEASTKEVIIKEEVAEAKEQVKEEKVEGKIIKSPMVGTFYSKPSPDAAPFVEVNQEIKKGKTVCIIEAMKLMNEIESEFDGKVVEILIKDGDMVEYGTPLFRIV